MLNTRVNRADALIAEIAVSKQLEKPGRRRPAPEITRLFADLEGRDLGYAGGLHHYMEELRIV
jgi:hypothetical protein